MIKDLEGRLQSLRSEHGSARDREEQRQRENAELNSRLGEADKVIIIRGIRTALKSLARAIPHML